MILCWGFTLRSGAESGAGATEEAVVGNVTALPHEFPFLKTTKDAVAQKC